MRSEGFGILNTILSVFLMCTLRGADTLYLASVSSTVCFLGGGLAFGAFGAGGRYGNLTMIAHRL